MIRTLNSLRFILILMIVASHSTLEMSQGLNCYLGEYAVAIFFVISGFVLSLGKGEKLQKGELSYKQFVLSRAIKLYPLHILIIAIMLVMDWRLGHLVTWQQALAQILLLQCWYPSHYFVAVLNASTWFISDIIFFYFIFKYLYIWIMKNAWRNTLPIIILYIASYIALCTCSDKDYSAGYLYLYPPFRLIDFGLGILLYKFYSSQMGKQLSNIIANHQSIRQAYLTDLLLVLSSIGMYLLSLNSPANIRCAALYWLPAIITVFYVTAADKGNGWLTSILHNRLLLGLGSISFEIYLCHGLCLRIIQSCFLKIYGEHIPCPNLQFGMSLSLILLMAWAAKKYIVTPTYQKLQTNL